MMATTKILIVLFVIKTGSLAAVTITKPQPQPEFSVNQTLPDESKKNLTNISASQPQPQPPISTPMMSLPAGVNFTDFVQSSQFLRILQKRLKSQGTLHHFTKISNWNSKNKKRGPQKDPEDDLEGSEDAEEEEDDAVDPERAEGIRLGLLPKAEDSEGMFAYVRKAAPSVMNIVKGALNRNEAAIRDLFVLLAYEAASVFP